MMDLTRQPSRSAALQRRERRLRSMLRHERMSVAMALAEKLHHSARTRGEERDELHNATGQKTPPPRAASTVYFSLDDDGDVLAAPPDRLYEVMPLDRVLRRTVEQNVDAVTFPSLDVPEPQMENQLVEVLQKIGTRSSHQVIEVPEIFPVSVPQHLVESRPPQLAEQLVEVPTEPVYVLMVLASKVFSRRELSGLLSGQGSAASGSGFLEEVVDNPLPQGRGGGGARGGLQGSCARQNSTASDVEQIVDTPARRGLPDFSQAGVPHHSFLIDSFA